MEVISSKINLIEQFPVFLTRYKDGYPYSVMSHVNVAFTSLNSDKHLGKLSFLSKSLLSLITQSTISVINKNFNKFYYAKVLYENKPMLTDTFNCDFPERGYLSLGRHGN